MDVESILENIKPLTFECVDVLPEVGDAGVVYITNLSEYLYVDGDWAEIGRVDTSDVSQPMEIVKIERPRLTNCKNCGAVLEGSKCKYCGTHY